MSMDECQMQRIICEEQIKYLIDLRQRFRQYLKQNFNTIWYSCAREYFQKDCELLDISLIECVCDLITINQLLSNETHDDFLFVLKTEKSSQINDKLDDGIQRVYFKRRYRALINSREILLDDLSQSHTDDRMMKIRAICVLDEEFLSLQQEFTFKSLHEQTTLRLQQIRAMINVYFKQISPILAIEPNSSTSGHLPFIHACDSFLSTLRLFLNNTVSDINLSDSQNE